MSFHSGWVGILGPTNAGKSTLLNRVIGEKIAIMTPKPQTTRHRIQGIYTDAEAQIIFCDTPGFHDSDALLNQEMLALAFDTVADMDIVCLVLDATFPQWKWIDAVVSRYAGRPLIVVFNKADRLAESERLALAQVYNDYGCPFPVYFISALEGGGVDALLATLKQRLPEGPAYYPDDSVTDRNWRFLAAETVREKCFLVLEQELPYGLAVVIDSFKEGTLVQIEATIVINRESHKGMVIGKGGATLKKIGELARHELEAALGQKVFLKLFVRVEKNWTKDDRKIKEFVYSDDASPKRRT